MSFKAAFTRDIAPDLAAGLLAHPGDNLKYVGNENAPVEKRIAATCQAITEALIAVAEAHEASSDMYYRMAKVAVGILSSPHDNLKLAEAAAHQKSHTPFFELALVCYKIANELPR